MSMKNFVIFPHLMSGTTDNGWEDGAWSIISSETGFAHTRAVVNDQSSYFVFHDEGIVLR